MIDDSMSRRILILGAALLVSCDSSDQEFHQRGEYISRYSSEHRFQPDPPLPRTLPVYPWEEGKHHLHPTLSKEFFRCKGSSLNPRRTVLQRNGAIEIEDCGGTNTHSLPLNDGEESIYPVLIELLNYLQEATDHRIVITSGHRCPKHHLYVRNDKETLYSKHMIGAEVNFYLQGMEEQPMKVVQLLQDFYKKNDQYREQKEYSEFARYTRSTTDVSIQPWYNKEIFIKLYQSHEGRNFDNRHPFPYLSVQVRYDRDKGKRVNFSWELAEKNYLRW